jgi:hypothetical protein
VGSESSVMFVAFLVDDHGRTIIQIPCRQPFLKKRGHSTSLRFTCLLPNSLFHYRLHFFKISHFICNPYQYIQQLL